MRLRKAIRQMIDERKQGKLQTYEGQEDNLISILIREEMFRDNSQMIEDEIIAFFFAGALTIQASTTNLILYSITYPEVKRKL